MSVSPAESHHALVRNENVNALEATKNSPHIFACLTFWSMGNVGRVMHDFKFFTQSVSSPKK